MLGGTDLALAFNESETPFPLMDCAGAHADAIARLAGLRLTAWSAPIEVVNL